MTKEIRVELDRSRCSGHGRCYDLAPEVFEADEDGYGTVKVRGPLEGPLLEAARRGELSCPERAISLVEEQREPGGTGT